MEKRSGLKAYAYTLFVLLMLMVSWESGLTNAAVYQPVIPEESIRLRILANSDSPMDQWIKRKVRDEIIQFMNENAAEYDSLETAREALGERLPDIQAAVGGVLRRYGFAYGAQVELAEVQFPAKLYGRKLYPAGDYEALRISLGSGKGENWWCVLFPPLCFVEIINTETGVQAAEAGADEDAETSADAEAGPEVRFFLWDMLKKVISTIKAWFQ